MLEISDLVEYEGMRVQIRNRRCVELAERGGVRDMAGRGIRRIEARDAAVLHGAIRKRDDLMRVPSPLGS